MHGRQQSQMTDVIGVQGADDWTVSEETTAPRGWAIIEALSPETVYEIRVVARSPAGRVESASVIQRVRIGLKRGTVLLFLCSSRRNVTGKLFSAIPHRSNSALQYGTYYQTI